MYDFNIIYALNSKLKPLLVDYFQCNYFEVRAKVETNNMQDDISEGGYLPLFQIPQSRESIFSKITSIDKLDEVKKEVSDLLETFKDDLIDYVMRVEKQLDENNLETFDILINLLKNREKKLNTKIRKFKIEDSWKVAKIQEEFLSAIYKNLADIIYSFIRPIEVGLKENSSYEEVLKLLNRFISDLGIYTKDFQAGDKLSDKDDGFVEYQECGNCDTTDSTKKDVIKQVLSYPYLINKDDVILSGKIFVWRVKNG